MFLLLMFGAAIVGLGFFRTLGLVAIGLIGRIIIFGFLGLMLAVVSLLIAMCAYN